MKRATLLVVLFLGGLLAQALAVPVTFVADPAHSSIGFSVRNVLVRVSGRFTTFNATLQVDADNPEHNRVDAEIQIASIATGEKKRDTHLQQPEFFDAAKFPVMTFQSTRWKKTGNADFEIAGNLTIRGVTKPLVLKAHLIDSKTDPQRWEGKATLNRHDFAVSGYNGIIGADVDIAITLVAHRKS